MSHQPKADLAVKTSAPRPGDTLPTLDGGAVKLDARFGQGGQGGVYGVAGDPHRCVKVYYIDPGPQADGLRRRFEKLKAKAAGLNTETLVLPTAVLAPPYVGYVMHRVQGAIPLKALAVAPRDEDIADWYSRTGGLRRRLLLGYALVQAFRELHLKGLAYNDLSWENVLVPETGRPSVHLIDCDNLSVDGVPSTGIEGTPWFIAPEVVSGGHQPDSLSDLHAFAVLLYHLLTLIHPLLGDKIRAGTPEEEQAALSGLWPFGEQPPNEAVKLPWVDHPDDHRNQTKNGLPRDMVLSSGMRALFHQAFFEGLRGPTRTERPSEKRWMKVLGQATDATVICPHCGQSYFINQKVCPWCDAARPPHWVLLCGHPDGRRPVVIQLKRRLHSRHLHGNPNIDAVEVLATVQVTLSGLKLHANRPIDVTLSGGQASLVEPGAHHLLKPGDGFQLAQMNQQPVFVEVRQG